ncbi:transcription initiation factor TFIID subunit 5 [Drosophila elegans]|uniref:transcription initiation factor TFIID subunit 5 n=1 Tax=Drosophila elegans TaxID=30023 RepID=UPI0007E772A2|nr:transcription initiation factor TFIID subunit 5 [Drosophila elegans]
MNKNSKRNKSSKSEEQKYSVDQNEDFDVDEELEALLGGAPTEDIDEDAFDIRGALKALNENVNVISISDSDSDSKDETRKKHVKASNKQDSQKANQPKTESKQMKMNKWYLKEFEEHMGFEIGESDDEGDKAESKSEKSTSSESEKVSDWDDSNSDGSPSEWLTNLKDIGKFTLDKSSEEAKPSQNEECVALPVFNGPMPSMPIYDEETSQFEIVQNHKEPEIIEQIIEMEKPSQFGNETEKTDLPPLEEEDYLSDSDISSNFSLSSGNSLTRLDEGNEDISTDLNDESGRNELTYWEEMSTLPVDKGEISQEDIMAIMKEEENQKNSDKSPEHRSDSEVEEAARDQTVPHNGSDFYEDSTQFPENRENFSVLVIKEESVFVDYEKAVEKLVKLVESAPSHCKYEINQLIYPLVALTYLQMMASDKRQGARLFLIRNQDYLDDSYLPRLMKLRDILRPQDVPNKARKLLAGHEKLEVQMSQDAYRQFLCYTEEWPKGQQEKLLAHFQIQTYGEGERPQQRFVLGKPLLEPIFWAAPEPLHKKEYTTRPFLQKRRRRKNEPQAHKNLHLPPADRVYNPNPKRMDLLHRKNDEQHRMRLDREHLPSTYLYTAPPSDEKVICASFSESISMLALGTASSAVHIFSLKPSKLVQLKSASWLNVLDTGMAGIDKGMLDPTKKSSRRTLHGHQGPVYGCSFNPDDRFLLSCSEDFSVRMWCLLSWSCVVIFPGHLSAVCFVVFAPMGYYFATASDDCTARVWVQDNRRPARILQGHLAELAVCIFHPNRQYLATGSADCTVRMWDIVKGAQVRVFTGHTHRINALTYSICGRYLVSGGDDNLIMVWDTAHEVLIRFLDHHKAAINTLEIALDNNLLVVGGQDCQLTIWDFERMLKDYLGRSKTLRKRTEEEEKEKGAKDLLIGSYPSKGAPFYMIRFSRRNLLVAFCVSPQESIGNNTDVKEKHSQHQKNGQVHDWLNLLDTLKLKACVGLKKELHVDTEQVKKEEASTNK